MVFGRVISGMEVVKAIELTRTNAQDKPIQPIIVSNCGEIKQTAAAEGAAATTTAAAALKGKSAATIDHDSDDEQHELSATAAAASSSQPLYPVSNGARVGDAAPSAVAAAVAEEARLKAELAKLPADLNPRARKMAELKLKMAAGSRANAAGVAEEGRKVQSKEAAAADSGESGSKKQLSNAEFQAKRAAWEKDQLASGSDPALAYLHETAENAEHRGGIKKDKAMKNKASFGWDVFNADAQYNAYTKRLNALPGAAAAESEQNASAASSSSALVPSAAALGSLNFATAAKPSKAGVDRMVAELAERAAGREKFSRRRAFNEEEDVSYINERNRMFNKKAMRAYEPYTLEIRQNIERGTAL